MEQIPDQQGRLRLITTAAPAVGTDVVIVQDARVRWLLRSFMVEFVADGTAANRVVNLGLEVGGNIVTIWIPRTQIAAGITRTLCFVVGITAAAPTGGLVIGGHIPPRTLVNGQMTIRTIVTNIQVGDQFGISQLMVEEWIEPLV